MNIDRYVDEIIKIANDDTHGYSQINRDGDPDYDCSSLVIHCIRAAGGKMAGATYTGNMLAALKKDGFQIVTDVSKATGEGLERGDILLTPNKHTAIYIGNGKMAAARIDEVGGIQGKKKGDQTGKEICIQEYHDHPWKYVLRYPQEIGDEVEKLTKEVIFGRYGVGDDRKKALGDKYNAVQKRVNEYYHTAEQVIRGTYGNGNDRRNALSKAGYDPDTVQYIVNRIYWRI